VGSFVRVVQLHIHGGSRKKSLEPIARMVSLKIRVVSDKSREPFFWNMGLNEESIEERTLNLFFTMTTTLREKRIFKTQALTPRFA
jgi:hypothetical protein